MKNDSCLNDAQRLVMENYGVGEYQPCIHAIDNPEGETSRQALDSFVNGCGDGLLEFLMVELSDTEDCEDLGVALGRVNTAIEQLEHVKKALKEAYLCGAE